MNLARANRRLHKAFDKLNDLYFNNRLRIKSVQYAKISRNLVGITDFFDNGEVTIKVSDKLICTERMSTVVLLHEMAHVSNGSRYVPLHGQLHAAELHRLYMMGAYEGLL